MPAYPSYQHNPGSPISAMSPGRAIRQEKKKKKHPLERRNYIDFAYDMKFYIENSENLQKFFQFTISGLKT